MDDLRCTLNSWETSHNNALELYSLQAQLINKQVQLADAQRTLSKLRQQTAAGFSQIHGKKSGISGLISFGKSKKPTQAEKDAQDSFENLHSEERQQVEIVDELQNAVNNLTSKRDAALDPVSTSDYLWTRLHSATHGRVQVSEEIDAEEALHKADAEVEEAQRQVAALSRARLSIQHAHKYYSDALKVSDDLNPGSKAGILSEGFGGNLVSMSKENDYKAAIQQAEKSQTCLDECLRCLEQYQYSIPEENAVDFEALKTSGVTQIKRIYELMYKGQTADTSIRDSVKTMLERQETAFKQLTRSAVWTQARVPEREIAESQAKLRREEARGRLASFWKKV